ncbi:hypothetical protein DN586_22525 [Enterobacter cloacae]|nr:hypothetical protein DN586_22525 [Enterobacter cloacae]
MNKTLIHRRTDPVVFGGGVAGKTATIWIQRAFLSGDKAFCASRSLVSGKKAYNRKPFWRFKGLCRFGLMKCGAGS